MPPRAANLAPCSPRRVVAKMIFFTFWLRPVFWPINLVALFQRIWVRYSRLFPTYVESFVTSSRKIANRRSVHGTTCPDMAQICWRHPTNIAHIFWKFHDSCCNRFSVLYKQTKLHTQATQNNILPAVCGTQSTRHDRARNHISLTGKRRYPREVLPQRFPLENILRRLVRVT